MSIEAMKLAAYKIGAKGAEPTEAERVLFEEWMRGHCWAVIGDWNGETYVHPDESNGFVNNSAMHTRCLWAAWRDSAALRQAIEQAQKQEPVAWEMPDGKIVNKWGLQFYGDQIGNPLYTSPPQRPAAEGEDTRKWVGLTDEEIEKTVGFKKDSNASLVYFSIARAVEAKLKEKNNAV